jgi:hypothetical protein
MTTRRWLRNVEIEEQPRHGSSVRYTHCSAFSPILDVFASTVRNRGNVDRAVHHAKSLGLVKVDFDRARGTLCIFDRGEMRWMSLPT